MYNPISPFKPEDLKESGLAIRCLKAMIGKKDTIAMTEILLNNQDPKTWIIWVSFIQN